MPEVDYVTTQQANTQINKGVAAKEKVNENVKVITSRSYTVAKMHCLVISLVIERKLEDVELSIPFADYYFGKPKRFNLNITDNT